MRTTLEQVHLLAPAEALATLRPRDDVGRHQLLGAEQDDPAWEAPLLEVVEQTIAVAVAQIPVEQDEVEALGALGDRELGGGQ